MASAGEGTVAFAVKCLTLRKFIHAQRLFTVVLIDVMPNEHISLLVAIISGVIASVQNFRIGAAFGFKDAGNGAVNHSR